MAKVKYQFNTKSLTIEKVRLSFKDWLLKVLSVITAGLVFSAVVIFIAYNFFNSPKEKMQQREIEQYKLQYEILSDRLDQIARVLNDLEERDDNVYRVIFEAEPIPSSVRQAGYGGADKYARLEGFKNSDIITETTKKLDNIANRVYVQSKSFDDVFKMAKNKEKMLACIPAIQPVSNKDLKRIASGYGWRTHPILKRRIFHYGIDFTAPRGANIYATGDGVVVEAKRARGGYGNRIVIDHGYGYMTLYAHLDKFNVRGGEKVKRGQIIGTIGNTGLSLGSHLHYEVHKNGKKVNPVYYFYNDLTPEEYEKVIELASRDNQVLS